MKFVALVAFALFVAVETTQATVVVLGNYTQASVADGTGEASDSITDATLPVMTSLDVAQGGTHSNNGLDWTTSGGQTTLSFEVDHLRVGETSAQTRTFVDFPFSVDADTSYEATGFYNVADNGANDNGQVEFHVRLSTIGTDEDIFDNYLISNATHDEQFTLGSLGGDQLDIFVGSTTGILVPGSYRLFIDMSILSNANGDAGASALGNITLTLGSAIPEPASILIVVGMLAGVCQSRRLR